MKLLTFSTLYPNAEQPNHGIFVETRLRYLVASGKAESRVVAPVPWFPSNNPKYGPYAGFARVPRAEQRNGLSVVHPRYLVLPRIGMNVAPFTLAQSAKKAIGRIRDEGYDFDAIDAHYFYPDGVAAVMLGKYFNKPVVITARGTDINLIPQFRLPRKMIMWAGERANGIVTVCNALKEEIQDLGVNNKNIVALRNGVDLQRFQPADRNAARAALNIQGFTMLSVGLLDPRKGHDIPIRALAELPDVRLMIAGSGPDLKKLQDLAAQTGVADRVTFLGPIPQTALAQYYNAADVLVLASSREGWANVLLESMACGTPVIASNVWGTPEVVHAPEAGLLMGERTPASLATSVRALRASYPDHHATRRYAERFSWDDTTQGQLDLFQQVILDKAA